MAVRSTGVRWADEGCAGGASAAQLWVASRRDPVDEAAGGVARVRILRSATRTVARGRPSTRCGRRRSVVAPDAAFA
jgi:hypothetical protein